MIHEMSLNPNPFSRIAAGLQTIETRLFDEKRQRVKVGDEIVFSKLPDKHETFTVKVLAIQIFPTFKEMFTALEPTQLGYPTDVDLETQLKAMTKYYSEEEQKKYGVVAIYLKK